MKFLTYIQALAIIATLSGCNTKNENEYRSDERSIKAGKELFISNCSSCHSFTSNGIGPNLSAVTTANTKQWLSGFIHDPGAYIANKDAHAVALISQFKMPMPAFNYLSDDAIENILAYINQYKTAGKSVTTRTDEIINPFKDSIHLSSTHVSLKLIGTIPKSSEQGLGTRITKLHDRGDGLFIVDIRGKLYRLRDGKPQVYFDISKARPKFVQEPGLGTGFGSFAFHPDFKQNGLLYTTHTEPPASAKADFSYADSIDVKLQWVITEWKTNHPDENVFSGQGRELLRLNVVTGIHGVQEITFNDKAKSGDADYGLLYIGVGDSGCAEAGHPDLLMSDSVYLGTILRIDPAGHNSRNGNYGIPSTNPFVNKKSTKFCKEVYAYGFRNPHRLTWLTSGEMIVANIGQKNIESLYKLKPGANHGWPIREGKFALEWPGDINKIYPLPPDDSLLHINYPVLEYDHDDGISIAGGYEYYGRNVPSLKGKFVFADLGKGRIFFTDVAALRKNNTNATVEELQLTYNGKPTTSLQLLNRTRADLRLGRDHEGELYILMKPDGKVYKLSL